MLLLTLAATCAQCLLGTRHRCTHFTGPNSEFPHDHLLSPYFTAENTGGLQKYSNRPKVHELVSRTPTPSSVSLAPLDLRSLNPQPVCSEELFLLVLCVSLMCLFVFCVSPSSFRASEAEHSTDSHNQRGGSGCHSPLHLWTMLGQGGGCFSSQWA